MDSRGWRRKLAGMYRRKQQGSGLRKQKRTARNQSCFAFKPQMESIMTLVAEWFSLEELLVLQGVSVLMSVYVRRVAVQGHSEGH